MNFSFSLCHLNEFAVINKRNMTNFEEFKRHSIKTKIFQYATFYSVYLNLNSLLQIGILKNIKLNKTNNCGCGYYFRVLHLCCSKQHCCIVYEHCISQILSRHSRRIQIFVKKQHKLRSISFCKLIISYNFSNRNMIHLFDALIMKLSNKL